MRIFDIICLLVVTAAPSLAQITTAERSDFQSTSTHAEVISFINELTEFYSFVRIDTIAMSAEGRVVPLLVLGDPLPAGPEDLVNDDRLVVYLQANIHAGEVEGKEASLMLARSLLKLKDPVLFDNLVMLFCPILNPDGNDRISPQNRTNQNGPRNGVGLRHNGQYLDLNRDAMKLETPEMRGVVTQVLNRWDPAITVDCHTTNGSYHEEPVTFTWMMNPNGDRALIDFMRDVMMPEISEQLANRYNIPNVFYGEFVDFHDYQKGWISYASEPRYLVNYIGLRNRLSILNENYVYAEFKTRVLGCYYLLWSILEYAATHKDNIKTLIREADERSVNRWKDLTTADSFAIEYEGRPTPEPVTIKAFEVVPNPEPNTWPYYLPTDRNVTVTVPYIADYYPTKSIRLPYAYLLTIPDKEVLDLLKIHGIRFDRIPDSAALTVERFSISQLTPAERLNQGHYTNRVKGEFIEESRRFPPGTVVIMTAQPLGGLAAYLLEPLSDDSMLLWNFFDRYLVPQWGRGFYPYPVYRLMKKDGLSIEQISN